MLADIAYRCRTILRSSRGSATVETTLIFPFLLLCILLFIFLALHYFFSLLVQTESMVMAERIAYTWDNKHKDHVSGAYDTKDHLYWFLTTLSAQHTVSTFTPQGTVDEMSSRLNTFSSQATPHYHFFHQGSLTFQSRLLPKLEVHLTYQLPLNHVDSELSRSSSIYLIHPSGYLYDYKFLDYLIKNTVSDEQQQKLKEVFNTQ